jgi:hypothetical protein
MCICGHEAIERRAELERESGEWGAGSGEWGAGSERRKCKRDRAKSRGKIDEGDG